MSQSNAIFGIHVEQGDCCAAFGCQPKEPRLDELEVMPPNLRSRVKERGYEVSLRIDRRDIGALLQVTADAREAQILHIVRAVVLAPDDVIDLMR